MSQTRPYNKWGIRPNLSWNETSSHFDFFFYLLWEIGLWFEEKKSFLGSLCSSKKKMEEIKIWNFGMEPICMEFL